MSETKYDVVVVGGGHAGIEAAMAAEGMGCRTALISLNIEMIGHMPCNPAMGGLGKSQIVREIDALGGWIGRLADRTAIQFRVLNTKKGPAVRALRTQNDKVRYREEALKLLQSRENLDLIQEEVVSVLVAKGGVAGVRTRIGVEIPCRAVVLTPGTFLNGLIHVGLVHSPAGRLGEFPASGLTASLRALGFRMDRLKTGTPARIDRRSICFDHLEEQPGDPEHPFFSHWTKPEKLLPQISCFLTYTNKKTHEIIRGGLDRSPLYSGKIKGIGPRYCPSIEDKIVRFPDKNQHQIFLEPEGLDSLEIYANGISTSLPYDVQVKMVRSIPGMENARLIRPAYAVEYDFAPPTQLKPTLETKPVKNLFFAGQINGTSGYEEAAGQGLLAGVNAVLNLREQAPLVLTRDTSYLGVMVDDLVTRGVDEPYRMFTSRAEYRLLLRSDNADQRLSDTGRRLGLVDDAQYERFQKKQVILEEEIRRLENQRISPSTDVLEKMDAAGIRPIQSPLTLKELLRRQEVNYGTILEMGFGDDTFPEQFIENLEILVKYEGYIQRQLEEIDQFKKLESMKIPWDMDYKRISGLSREVQQRLERVRPESLGQAARIPGVTPAAVSVLMVWIKAK